MQGILWGKTVKLRVRDVLSRIAASVRFFFVNTVVFTEAAVCTGETELYDLYAADGDKLALLSAAASAEEGEGHPFAAALSRAAKEMTLTLPQAADVCTVRGKGISARIGKDVYFFGSRRWLCEMGIAVPAAIRFTDFGGCSVLYAACNAAFCGVFLFQKQLLPAAVQTVHALQSLGIRTVLLSSGTQPRLARRLSVHRTEEALLKKKKEKVLHSLQKNAKILVVENPHRVTLCGVSVLSHLSDPLSALSDVFLRMQTVRRAAGQWLLALCGTALLAVACVRSSPFFALAAFVILAASVLWLFLRPWHRMPAAHFSVEETTMFGKVNYTMAIQGMNCTHCSARVKTALESLRGVTAEISLEEKLARIKCPASLDAEKLRAAVTEVGFTVVSLERV